MPIQSMSNQNLFWSGTFGIVTELSKNDLGVTVVSSANADASLVINMFEEQTGETPYWCGKLGGRY